MFNVVELRGRELPTEYVLLGAPDSARCDWCTDNGTGTVDAGGDAT
jgi:hypothetical protein